MRIITGFDLVKAENPMDNVIRVMSNQECLMSSRERTFPALELKIGQSVSAADIVAIKENESFVFKRLYGKDWEKEIERIGKVMALVSSVNDRLVAKEIGFGTGKNEIIKAHQQKEKVGAPDLKVGIRGYTQRLMEIEVTGTDRMRGNTFWVRPDKINYMKRNPDRNIWIVLVYKNPSKYVFIKPDLNKEYVGSPKVLKQGVTEYFVEFSHSAEEVKTFDDFRHNLLAKMEAFSRIN